MGFIKLGLGILTIFLIVALFSSYPKYDYTVEIYFCDKRENIIVKVKNQIDYPAISSQYGESWYDKYHNVCQVDVLSKKLVKNP